MTLLSQLTLLWINTRASDTLGYAIASLQSCWGRALCAELAIRSRLSNVCATGIRSLFHFCLARQYQDQTCDVTIKAACTYPSTCHGIFITTSMSSAVRVLTPGHTLPTLNSFSLHSISFSSASKLFPCRHHTVMCPISVVSQF